MSRIVMIRHLLTTTSLMILLTACAVGPQYQRPDVSVSHDWIAAADERLDRLHAPSATWWNQFDDLVLNQLIGLARANNLSLQVAAVRIQEARAGLNAATGLRLPQQQALSGDLLSVGLSDNSPNQAIADSSFTQASLNFDTVWELDIWGRFSRGVEIADADYLAAIAGYDQGTVIIVAEVARVYTSLRTLEARRTIAQDNVDTQRESLRIAQVRFDNGAVTELDVLQAKALLYDTKAIIPTIDAGIRETQHALSVLLGQPPSTLDALVGQPSEIPSSTQSIAIGAPIDLIRRRPDVRLAEFRAAAQSARIGLATTDLYPRFSLLGSIGLQTSRNGGAASNNAEFGELFDSDSVRYTVGPVFSWPIFNFGRIRNNIRIQDARFQQTALNYQATVLQAAKEVEDALSHYLHQRKRTAFLDQSVAAAQLSVDLALVQYRSGSVTYQRVLDTQRFLLRQQDAATTAKGEVTLNVIAANKALGGDWSKPRIVDQAVEQSMRERVEWDDVLNPDHPTENTQ